MGLDVTAYSRLNHIGEHAFDPEFNEGEDGPWCYYENHVQAYAYDSFAQSFRGVPVLGERSGWDSAKFLYGGCYEFTPETKTHSFRAGSYGSYNVWRGNLAEQFNPAPGYGRSMTPPDPELPFYELIWFADNEGCIGPEAALDLLADFDLHVNLYDPPEQDNDWYRRKYEDWHIAFKLGADGGLVRFH